MVPTAQAAAAVVAAAADRTVSIAPVVINVSTQRLAANVWLTVVQAAAAAAPEAVLGREALQDQTAAGRSESCFATAP